MSGSIAFGVRVPSSGPLATVENVVRTAKGAETLGFEPVQQPLPLWVGGWTDHAAMTAGRHLQHVELKFLYPTLDDLLDQMRRWAEEIIPHYAGVGTRDAAAL